MGKLKMQTPSLADRNYAALAEMFPNAVTETVDESGVTIRAIDADVLAQEINTHVVSGKEERYQFTWPDKKQSVLLANAPIAATLRPCRAESVHFDSTENLYIEGDNLDVLKLLRETYLNRVKMIYIDPPYNTGNDFIYEDDFSEEAGEFLSRDGQYDEDGNRMVKNLDSNGRFHTDWLNMIYPRLRMARDLLTDDGVIFISIDDNEIAQLRKICDEVFGEENFVGTFIWEKRTNRENRKMVSSRHDYVVCFAKNNNNEIRVLQDLPMSAKALANYQNPDNDLRGKWKSDPATAQAGHGTRAQFYELIAPNGKKHVLESGRCWLYTEDVMNKEIADGKIWFGRNGNGVPRIKTYLDAKERGLTPESVIFANDVGTNESAKNALKEIFSGRSVFETPKPVGLLSQLVRVVSSERDDLVLDFFSGSATTAHAVMQLNAEDGGKRKFIMVQLPEETPEGSEAFNAGYKNICEIGKERIRRAGEKILEDLRTANQQQKLDAEPKEEPDVGFRVLKIDSSNMKDVYYTPQEYFQQFDTDGLIDNIKTDRTAEDLLFQVMLDLGIPLSGKIEVREIEDRAVYYVNGGYLTACFQGVNDAIVTAIAKDKPYYAVFRDNSFASDSTRVNFEQIFRTYSPSTQKRVL